MLLVKHVCGNEEFSNENPTVLDSHNTDLLTTVITSKAGHALAGFFLFPLRKALRPPSLLFNCLYFSNTTPFMTI